MNQYSKGVISNRVIIDSMFSKMQELATAIINELQSKFDADYIIWTVPLDGSRLTHYPHPSIGHQTPSGDEIMFLYCAFTDNNGKLRFSYRTAPNIINTITYSFEEHTVPDQILVARFLCAEVMEKEDQKKPEPVPEIIKPIIPELRAVIPGWKQPNKIYVTFDNKEALIGEQEIGLFNIIDTAPSDECFHPGVMFLSHNPHYNTKIVEGEGNRMYLLNWFDEKKQLRLMPVFLLPF